MHYKSLKFSQYEDEILRGLSYCRKKIDDSECVRWETFPRFEIVSDLEVNSCLPYVDSG